MENESYQVTPIGYARQDDQGAYVEILEPFRAALQQLEHFSHVHVIWWATLADNPEWRALRVVEPPYAPGQQVGIFATRSPARPNPIADTVTDLLHLDAAAGIVRVAYLDAVEGTPVIDLKSYIPTSDRVRAPRVPAWMAEWPEWMPEDDWSPPGL